MKTAFITMAAAVAVLATPVSAKSIVIQHADLNLATAEGQKALDRRINSAAREVCGLSLAQSASPLRAVEAHRCVARAKASAAESFAMAVTQSGQNS